MNTKNFDLVCTTALCVNVIFWRSDIILWLENKKKIYSYFCFKHIGFFICYGFSPDERVSFSLTSKLGPWISDDILCGSMGFDPSLWKEFSSEIRITIKVKINIVTFPMKSFLVYFSMFLKDKTKNYLTMERKIYKTNT